MYGERCEKRAAAQITGIFFVDILSTDIFIFRLLSLFYTETNAASDAENWRILLEHAAEKIGSLHYAGE